MRSSKSSYAARAADQESYARINLQAVQFRVKNKMTIAFVNEAAEAARSRANKAQAMADLARIGSRSQEHAEFHASCARRVADEAELLAVNYCAAHTEELAFRRS